MEVYGVTQDGRTVERHSLRNQAGMAVRFLSLGGIVTAMEVPDRNGRIANVVFGLPDLADYEARTAPDFELYALGLEHKHLPEIVKYSRLERRPIFVPSVGDFRQGMLVQLPLHLDTIPGSPTPMDLHDALAKHYVNSEWVKVELPTEDGKLDALALNDTNRMELRVFHNMEEGLKDVDVIIMLRLQNERMSGALLPSAQEFFKSYGLTPERLALAKPDAIVMHPGPMNRGVEIDSAVADGAQAVILPQVTFGIAVRMAVMSIVAGN